MATHLKPQDYPETWLPTKNKVANTSQHEAVLKKLSPNVKAPGYASTLLVEPSKRGRGRPKGKVKVVESGKGRGRSKTMSTSTADVILGWSRTPVADVQELRQKIEQDTLACGHQVRSVLEMLSLVTSQLTETQNPIEQDLVDDGTPSLSYAERPSQLRMSKNETCREHGTGAARTDSRTTKECTAKEPQRPPQTVSIAGTYVRRFIEEYAIEAHNICEDTNEHRVQIFQPRRSSLGTPEEWNNEGKLSEKKKSPEDGHPLRCTRFERSVSRSPHRKCSRSTGMKDCRSPQRNWSHSSRIEEYTNQRRSASWSLGRCGGDNDSRSYHKQREFYSDCEGDDQYEFENRQSKNFSHREIRRSGRCSSTSPSRDGGRTRRNKFSQRESRRTGKHNLTLPRRDARQSSSHSLYENITLLRSKTPGRAKNSPTTFVDERSGRAPHWMGFLSVKKESRIGSSPASGRRERRRDQTIRKEEMATRQRNGQKPFYLTLDPEGKPYGPGKPAWIAQINKLAAGLDTSCTHIRKQTYEDVQTFKDRLNDDFKYSDKLNEDYLRGLMGKAVTKRRGELIALIKSGGKQPLTIDYQIWRRLQKLAYSRQREQKSEQGRYANSCRKTLGRTGSKGVDGVREKLRDLLQRSPHPDEVEEEMQRDKGFGGQKRKRRLQFSKREDAIGRITTSDEDSRSESVGKYSDGISSGLGSSKRSPRTARQCPESPSERTRTSILNYAEKGAGTKKPGSDQRSWSAMQAAKQSTEDYIESLKAEIQRLQAGNAKASKSSATHFSQSSMSMPCSSSKGGKVKL